MPALSKQAPSPTGTKGLGILILGLSSRIKMTQQKKPLRALCALAVQMHKQRNKETTSLSATQLWYKTGFPPEGLGYFDPESLLRDQNDTTKNPLCVLCAFAVQSRKMKGGAALIKKRRNA
jgi:hypothetical protein